MIATILKLFDFNSDSNELQEELNKIQEEKTQLLSIVKIQEERIEFYKTKLDEIKKQRSRKHLAKKEDSEIKFKTLIPKTPKKKK